MSDPSGGNFPPGGGGKGSNEPRGSSSGVTPTVADAPTGGESLPDDDGWGSPSEPPIAGIPVKTPAAYAPTEMLPVQPSPVAPPAQPAPSPTMTGDGPTIVPSGETHPPPAPQAGTGTAPGTSPLAGQGQGGFTPPQANPYAQYGAPPQGAPQQPHPHTQPGALPPGIAYGAAPMPPGVGPVGAQPYYGPGAGAHSPAHARSGPSANRQLIMLAGVLGGLFLMVGIVVGIVAMSRSKEVEPVAIATPPAVSVAEPSPPLEPTPIAPPVTVAPVVHPAPTPKAKKDAGAGPASSASAKPAASTSPPPSTSSSATPGGATGADAGRKGRKIPH